MHGKDRIAGRGAFALYCAVQFLYWAGGCIAISFTAAFLGGLGFSNSAIGLVISVSSVAGFLLMFLVSARIDAKGGRSLRRAFLITAVAMALLMTAVFLIRMATPLSAVCWIVYMAATHLLGSLVTKLYIDLNRAGHRIDFGIARGLGSLAYAVFSLLTGLLAARMPGSFYQFMGFACFLLLLPFSLWLCAMSASPPVAEQDRRPGFLSGAIAFLGSCRVFLALVLGVAFVSAANKTTASFLVNIVRNIGGDMRSFGLVNAWLALVEVPVILFYSRIRKRFSTAVLLMTGMVFFTLKTAAFTFIRSVPPLLLASTLQAFSVGLFQPSSVELVVERLPHEHTATAQSCLTGMPLLVSFLTTILFGFLLDRLPVFPCMLLLLLCSLAGTLTCFFALRRWNRPSLADPDRN